MQGHPLEAPVATIWDPASYVVSALDDSDGASVVLGHLLVRGAFVATSGLLRQARAPRIAHALIDAGAAIDGYDPPSPTLGSFMEDVTPLAAAVIHRDEHGEDRLAVAGALLARGASLEARDGCGRTPLIVAAEWGRAAPVRWLLERGARADCAADRRGHTPRSLAQRRPQDASSEVILAALAVG